MRRDDCDLSDFAIVFLYLLRGGGLLISVAVSSRVIFSVAVISLRTFLDFLKTVVALN